jgi:hypothetical protein
VAITPQTVTAIVSTFPAGARQGPRVVIRAEALSADIAARTGALSWHFSLNADCESRRVKLGETTGYSQRNLLGVRKILREAETGWRTPVAGTALEHAWRAACDPAFMGPFRSSSVKLAEVDAPATTDAETRGPMDSGPPPAPASAAPARPLATPKPARAAPAPVRGAPGLAAQLGAVGSDAAARTLLVTLAPRLQGRPTWVEKADVAGRTWHRAMVGGFADPADAGRFCAGLKASNLSCFVRQGRAN